MAAAADRGGSAPGSFVVGRRAAAEAVRAGIATEVLVAAAGRPTQGLTELTRAATEAGVSVRLVERSDLDVYGPDHRGAVAMLDAPRRPLSDRDLGRASFTDDAIVVVLDGITDPHNLGAAARSAEAAGAEMLVSRIKRSAGVTPVAVSASAGALLHMRHARVTNIPRALEMLKRAGFWVVGLDEAAEPVTETDAPTGKIALVVGSEGEGMGRLVRERCDLCVSLPMRGRVGSLNASASLAAVLYAWVLPSRADRR